MKDFPPFRDVEYLRGEGKPGKLLGNTEHLTSFLATRDRRGKREGTRQVKAKPGQMGLCAEYFEMHHIAPINLYPFFPV